MADRSTKGPLAAPPVRASSASSFVLRMEYFPRPHAVQNVECARLGPQCCGDDTRRRPRRSRAWRRARGWRVARVASGDRSRLGAPAPHPGFPARIRRAGVLPSVTCDDVKCVPEYTLAVISLSIYNRMTNGRAPGLGADQPALSSQRAAQVYRKTGRNPPNRKIQKQKTTCELCVTRERNTVYGNPVGDTAYTHLSSLRQRGRESDVRDALVRE